jgi:hypothetical protein
MLSACSSKDEQFCNCLNAGKELNDFSAKMFSGTITQEKANQLLKLKQAKKTACADYQTMDGAEMLKRKAECK